MWSAWLPRAVFCFVLAAAPFLEDLPFFFLSLFFAFFAFRSLALVLPLLACFLARAECVTLSASLTHDAEGCCVASPVCREHERADSIHTAAATTSTAATNAPRRSPRVMTNLSTLPISVKISAAQSNEPWQKSLQNYSISHKQAIICKEKIFCLTLRLVKPLPL